MSHPDCSCGCDAYARAQAIRQGYQRPRIPGQEELLAAAPVRRGDRILDVGAGAGDAARFFREKGLQVTATAWRCEPFDAGPGEFATAGIPFVRCSVEHLPFGNGSFDVIWMSHVLEHVMNPGLALQEVRRALVPGGWLLVMVPPFKREVVGGHLMTGWTIGQLMYVLLLNGFNVKEGHFVKYGYNVCGFVRKEDLALPPLHGDIGDIEALGGHWPLPFTQGFDGDMGELNWPPPGVPWPVSP